MKGRLEHDQPCALAPMGCSAAPHMNGIQAWAAWNESSFRTRRRSCCLLSKAAYAHAWARRPFMAHGRRLAAAYRELERPPPPVTMPCMLRGAATIEGPWPRRMLQASN